MSVLWDTSRLQGTTDILMPGDTITDIFWNAVNQRGSQLMMREKKFGIWQSWDWQQAGEAVRQISMGLMANGFEVGDCASILSNTRLEWVLADMAVLSAGGVSNGIYPTDSVSQVQYLCEDSRTTVLFVEDEEQLDKALMSRGQLPLLKLIVVIDTEGLTRYSDPMVISLQSLRDQGRKHERSQPGLFERRRVSRRPEDLAILIYTSGTTGKPKGAMHSHAGMVYAMRGYSLYLAQDQRDERMLFLPLCHIAERLGGMYSCIYGGAILNFVENPDTVPENVREIAPTLFFAVPRVWEKFYSAVTIAIAEAGAFQQAIYRASLACGHAVAARVLRQQAVPLWLKLCFHVARLACLNNVRRMMGIQRAKFLGTGAAPISPDLVRWYLALGIPMLEVWGQTESGGASTFMPFDQIVPGSIGKACVYNEVKVDPLTQELLIRGPNVFMGYLNQPDKTAETIDAEGWLHTGDVGSVDAQGFFKITDRMKDIIITAGGKNITPSEWENELKFSPYVTDAVVIGDKRAYLTVIIMIDLDNVEKFAQDHDVPFSNYASLTRAPEVQSLIQAEIDKVNAKFARVEQIKQFRLLDTQLTAEDDELTPTMKLKRKLVEHKYKDLIDSMYRTSTH
ncbi:MAG: long-chain fatty acid--CoA ligase [Betaproteobacteria bacterium]|nr:long-chain fatty acid--CoA ligase [Betaproteobacteria bacterium]